jgi:hypothetical protein
MKIKSWFLNDINNIDQSLVRLIRKKNDTNYKIKNETNDITADSPNLEK